MSLEYKIMHSSNVETKFCFAKTKERRHIFQNVDMNSAIPFLGFLSYNLKLFNKSSNKSWLVMHAFFIWVLRSSLDVLWMLICLFTEITLWAPLISLFCASSSPLPSVLLSVTCKSISACQIEGCLNSLNVSQKARIGEVCWLTEDAQVYPLWIYFVTHAQNSCDTQLSYTNHGLYMTVCWEQDYTNTP